MTTPIIYIQFSGSTDGFELVHEINGQQKVLNGWHESQHAAADAARDMFSVAVIVGLPADQGGADMVRTGEWLYDAARDDVKADSSDEDLILLAHEYQKDADEHRIAVDSDILEYLKEVRSEKIEETE